MTKDEMIKRVEVLNQAYQNIKSALIAIQKVIKFGKDEEVYFWRLQNNLNELFKVVTKKLNAQVVDDEFNKIIKMFEKDK